MMLKRKKEYQDVPRATLAGSSVKMKAMVILYHALSLQPLGNYLLNK